MTDLQVLCVGAANLDTIAVVDRYPAEDERVIAEAFLTAGGGPAATAAVALARQGVSVGLCATVGNDAEGTAVLEGLEAEGVDVAQVRRDGDTGRSAVVVTRPTASRAIVTSPPPEAPVPDVGGVDWIHVDHAGYAPAIAAGATDRSLSIDAGNPISDLRLRGTTLYAPTLAALLARYRNHTPAEAFDAAENEGAQIVIATDGANGTMLRSEGMFTHVPSFTVDAVSTVGAGDVFHGALLAGIVQGLTLPDAARRANACAALSCAGIDGRSAIPDVAALDKFLDANDPMTTNRNHDLD